MSSKKTKKMGTFKYRKWFTIATYDDVKAESIRIGMETCW